MILDSDPEICGLYPLDKNNEQHCQESIKFFGEPTDLFYLLQFCNNFQTENMDWTTYDELTGNELWHQRLGHVPHRNIKQTIQRAIGLESIIRKKFKRGHKCPSCMLGKSNFEHYPGLLDQPHNPSEVYMYSTSVTSMEGYNHTLIFTDGHGELRWHFGMKTKEETLIMAKRWFAEIADLRAKYPVLVVVTNNSG